MSSFNRIYSGKALSATGGSPLSDSGILTANGWMRMTVAVGTASAVQLVHNSVTLDLNSGVLLGADDLYTFNFTLPAGETFEVQFSVTNTVRVLIIDTVSEGLI